MTLRLGVFGSFLAELLSGVCTMYVIHCGDTVIVHSGLHIVGCY